MLGRWRRVGRFVVASKITLEEIYRRIYRVLGEQRIIYVAMGDENEMVLSALDEWHED